MSAPCGAYTDGNRQQYFPRPQLPNSPIGDGKASVPAPGGALRMIFPAWPRILVDASHRHRPYVSWQVPSDNVATIDGIAVKSTVSMSPRCHSPVWGRNCSVWPTSGLKEHDNPHDNDGIKG